MNKPKRNIEIFKNRKLKMFVTFLSLSILFWFLSKLSKEYTSTIRFKTDFVNMSNDKMLQNTPIDYIDLTLKSFGFNFLSYNLSKPRLKIDLTNIQKSNSGFYYYLTKNHFPELQSQISAEVAIVAIKPDTIFFDFGILKSKRVPIEPNLKLSFKNGFNLTDKVKIEPDFITISGPKRQIDSIVKITTEEIAIDKLYKNFTKTIALKTVGHINYSAKKIKITGKVEKFTEGSMTLDYRLINVPSGTSIDTFTKKIDITYKVSLKNFDKVFAKDFEIICDFAETQKDSLSYLMPKLINKSALVSSIKMNPTKIEYLIKK